MNYTGMSAGSRSYCNLTLKRSRMTLHRKQHTGNSIA